jgi:hypothetical protein
MPSAVFPVIQQFPGNAIAGFTRMKNVNANLQRLQRAKTAKLPSGDPLGPELVSFFKQSVAKRQTKLVKIAECWGNLIPQLINDHCSLEGLHRGTLTVLVDSSSHLYELKQLLLAGLQEQILLACKSTGLKKIALKLGQWYDPASENRAPRFD